MIPQPKPTGPVAFRGPRRRRYTVVEFARCYNLTTEKVVEWIQRGFLGAVHKGRREEATGKYMIGERDRLNMIRWFGSPENPKTKLPLD